MRAIETIYGGYRFRSRLEARWAVFFDYLGVRWEYEKEGYNLGVAGWYLPDFWLPDLRIWCEIKPNHLSASAWDAFHGEDQVIERKCSALCEATGHAVFLLTGELKSPLEQGGFSGEMTPYLVWVRVEDNPGDYWVLTDHFQLWCECPQCGMIDICYSAETTRCRCGCGKWRRWDNLDRIRDAYTAARWARFEHGEKG